MFGTNGGYTAHTYTLNHNLLGTKLSLSGLLSHNVTGTVLFLTVQCY